ncbi:MAG: DUF3466 family protein [Planctomycetota bacterium]
MRKSSVAIFATFCILLTPAISQATIKYHAINLGTLPGYDISRAWCINNNGQIVGEVIDSNYPTIYQAVLFDSAGDGNNIALGTLGGQYSSAQSINNNGQIVGAADNSADPAISYTAIFDPCNPANNIGLEPNSAALENNDNGQIVGYIRYDEPTGRIEQAVVFESGPEPNHIMLGTLDGHDRSLAISINNSKAIVGISYDSASQYYWDSKAVLFDSAGTGNNINLGTLPGYNAATAFSINDRGQIVGRVNHHDMEMMDNYYPRAVLFDPTGQGNNIDLGALPGYDSAEAYSINNKGWIVGRAYSHENGCSWCTTAILFDPTGNGNNQDLHELIDPNLGFGLDTAISINDNGWIACWGGTNQRMTSFLLIPIPAGPGDFNLDGYVNSYDFAVLASAWKTRPGDQDYNGACDIAEPKNNFIDERDLAVFTDTYLTGLFPSQ